MASELRKFLVNEMQVPAENFKGRDVESVAIEVMRAMTRAYQTVKMHLDVMSGTVSGGAGNGPTIKKKEGFTVDDHRPTT